MYDVIGGQFKVRPTAEDGRANILLLFSFYYIHRYFHVSFTDSKLFTTADAGPTLESNYINRDNYAYLLSIHVLKYVHMS